MKKWNKWLSMHQAFNKITNMKWFLIFILVVNNSLVAENSKSVIRKPLIYTEAIFIKGFTLEAFKAVLGDADFEKEGEYLFLLNEEEVKKIDPDSTQGYVIFYFKNNSLAKIESVIGNKVKAKLLRE